MKVARYATQISPCGLIQEHIKDDPWRVLVACIMMNMTRGLTMRPYMWRLFERYPTAQALAAADPASLEEMISPLGLSVRRSRSLITMSQGYTTSNWTKPSDLPGCGKYADDSWKIFCTDDDVDINTLRDKELRRYVYWLTTGIYVSQDKTV